MFASLTPFLIQVLRIFLSDSVKMYVLTFTTIDLLSTLIFKYSFYDSSKW